jgi:hypothetical protein
MERDAQLQLSGPIRRRSGTLAQACGDYPEGAIGAPREYQGHPVLYQARIPSDVQERTYTYPERTHPTPSGKLVQADRLILVDWHGTSFMVYEVGSTGDPLDDTWFQTIEEALELYNDVDWEKVEAR